MLRRAGTSLFVLLLSLMLPISVALAHARYDHSTPSAGQVVSTAPAAIDIFTVQDMRKTAGSNQTSVTSPDGTRGDDGTTVVDDSNRRHFSTGLKPGLPNGRYVVNFQTLSDEDAETDRGSFAFYVGVQPTNDQKTQDAKLTLTSQSDETPEQSHTGIYIAIAIALAVVVVIAAGGLLLVKGRHRTP